MSALWKSLMVLGLVTWVAGTASAESAHVASLSGRQTGPVNESGDVVQATTSGDLAGQFAMTLVVSGDQVTGGTWQLSVAGATPEAPPRAILQGTVLAGSAILTGDGALDSLSGVSLSITGAEGDLAAVASGSGTLTIHSTGIPEAPLAGELRLEF